MTIRNHAAALASGLLILAAAASCNDTDTQPKERLRDRTTLDYSKRGTGPEIEAGDAITLHYRVTTANGGLIADTREFGAPVAVIVGRGLEVGGWDAALLQMRVGDECTAFVPWELGFGPNGIEGAIPPKADLVYETTILGKHEVQIEFLVKGKGEHIQPRSWARLHYLGRLPGGDEFDSSYGRGEPIDVAVGAGDVIRGWEAALLQLRQGDKAKVLIPWQLAYGEAGRAPAIPPRADLEFLLEVLEVRPPQ